MASFAFSTDRDRLDTYGPYPASRRQIVLFEVGNDFEDHGPALAPDVDTIFVQYFAVHLAAQTGIQYLGHIPFTTDVVDFAPAWCPAYLPPDEFFSRTLDYLQYRLSLLSYTPREALIIAGHGRNVLEDGREQLREQLGIPVAITSNKLHEGLARLTEADITASPLASIVAEMQQLKYFDHAACLDYSVAAAMGVLDYDRLRVVAEAGAQDRLGTLRRWPAIAGLGGYMEFGDEQFAPLRTIHALEYCLDLFKRDPIGSQSADPVLGHAILCGALDELVAVVISIDPGA
jgi:creatinine amidohydrolase/Fe(II)-dependent formamide hydrolase-like protein